jgi:hypothetical protein
LDSSLERVTGKQPNPSGFGVSAQIAREELGKLLDKPDSESASATSAARIYIGLGDKERAFEWLGKAVSNSDPGLFLKTDPVYDFLRSDPRFHELRRRMKLN